MKIIFSGGGTLGPVTPLLAIKEIIQEKYPEAEFFWVGTKRGPERKIVEKANIRFTALSSGKFRRYLSLWNIVDIFRITIGFFQSIKLLWKEYPDVCISAGGFISVPLHHASWLLGIPTWFHNQDVRVGLANKLMSPFAKIITTALEQNVVDYPKKKTQWLGNLVRQDILQGSKEKALKIFKLKKDLPTIFATGGGTGSLRVNQLVVESMEHLKGFVQMIHLSGKERPQELVNKAKKLYKDYQVHQFFTSEMRHAYAVADIVISRGGFGTLTEIAALGKIAIIIPKSGHQVENVKILEKAKAVIFVDERIANGLYLAKIIKELLKDKIRKKQLAYNLQKMLPVAKSEDVLNIFEKIIK